MAFKLFDFTLSNPIRPIMQGEKLVSDTSTFVYYTNKPNYNTQPFDYTFFKRWLRSYEDKKCFIQPYQKSDTLFLQWLSLDTNLGHYSARYLRKDGTTYDNKTITIVKHGTTFAGETLYYIVDPLYDLPEGIYFLQVFCSYSGSIYPVLFEPIEIKQSHPKTLLIENYNSYNDNGLIYVNSWYKPQLRVKGYLSDIKPAAKINAYENQSYDHEYISGVPYRQLELTLSDLPEWLADRINRLTMGDGVKIDGQGLSRPEGGTLEPKQVQNNPFADYTLKLREAVNTDSVVLYQNSLDLGDMPQTSMFFVESMTIETLAINIRKGFDGKRNFLDYLNSEKSYKAGYNGYWSESPTKRLMFTPDLTYTASGTWSITASEVLKYALRLHFTDSATLGITITPPAGTQYYATSYGVNRTVYAGATALAPAYSTKFDNSCTIYFSDALSIVNTGTPPRVKAISGNLPPSITTFNMSNSSAIEYMYNNIFTYTTVLAVINLSGNKFGSYEINNILNYLFDVRKILSASCVATLSGQTPSAPPIRTEGVGFIISNIKASITTLTTD